MRIFLLDTYKEYGEMIHLQRTNSENPEFLKLNNLLDAELAIRDGKDHSFYAHYNTIADINHIVIAFENEIAMGCGAIKEYESSIMEIKRMYVPGKNRVKGIASKILYELENWGMELGAEKCILETGYKQPEAISLYKKNGYHIIPNYGQYRGVENSVCFEKVLHR